MDGANFGSSVALSRDGNTMAVAAYYESSAATGINGNQNDHSISEAGAVYIFTRTGTTWSQQAYIKASNTGQAAVGDGFAEGDQFGYSIALSSDGNTLAVGAIGEDSAATGINGDQADNMANQAGAAYVFTRTGSTWSQQAYVKSSMTRPNVLFGYSIGLSGSGDTLAVAEYDADRGKGALYVLARSGGTWSHQARIQADNAENGDSLGYSMAISDDGNTIAAGAADEDCLIPGINPAGCDKDQPSDTSAGAAYVFVRNGTTWTQQAFLKSSHPHKSDWFGVRIAISGDGNTVAVSAPQEDGKSRGINGNQEELGASEAGAVYFYTRSGTTWTQQAYVKSSNSDASDEFGSSIALSQDGKTMLVARAAKTAAPRASTATRPTTRSETLARPTCSSDNRRACFDDGGDQPCVSTRRRLRPALSFWRSFSRRRAARLPFRDRRDRRPGSPPFRARRVARTRSAPTTSCPTGPSPSRACPATTNGRGEPVRVSSPRARTGSSSCSAASCPTSRGR